MQITIKQLRRLIRESVMPQTYTWTSENGSIEQGRATYPKGKEEDIDLEYFLITIGMHEYDGDQVEEIVAHTIQEIKVASEESPNGVADVTVTISFDGTPGTNDGGQPVPFDVSYMAWPL